MSISSRRSPRSEEGFSIVEVMVAAMLLLVGLLGTLTLMDGATQTVATSKAREGGTNLAREVLERSRSLPFSTLTSASLTTNVRAMPDMGGGTSAPWTITRRGIAYTVSPVVCSLDDPADGLGAHTAASFCTSSSATGTADSQPEDFKRVAVTVTWTASNVRRQATLTAVRSNRSAAEAPTVSELTTTSPSVPDPVAPVISDPATTTATFKITASSSAAAVKVSLDGVDVGDATSLGNAKDWTYTLNVSTAVLKDGTYSLGARAIDARTNSGPTVTIPLTLVRIAPAAPAGLQGGRNEVLHNGNLVDAAELDWLPSEERNVIGYRVYRPDNSPVCPNTEARTDTWCVDVAPQAGTYGVTAIYKNASGAVQESARSTVTIVPAMRTFYMKNSTAATSTAGNCGTGANQYRDLAENFAGLNPAASEPISKHANVWRFCSPPLAATTIAAGTATVRAFMSNSGATCRVTVGAGTGGGLSGTSFKDILAGTGIAEYRYDFPYNGTSIAAGTQLVVFWSVPTGGSCDGVRMSFGGTTNRSRLELPRDWASPAPPSGLTTTPDGHGGVTVSWTASSTPAASLFGYRVYRDGQDWTNRLGVTGDGATLSFSDPNREGGGHTYWVTAVNQNLAESAQIGPVGG